MTAVNIIKTSSAVHMITDGMTWNNAVNKKMWEQPKAFIAPNLNLVLSVSGNCMFTHLFGVSFVKRATTYDALKGNLRQLVSLAMQEAGEYINKVPDTAFVLYVAGISETSGPDAYCYSNSNIIGQPHIAHDIVGLGLCPSTGIIMDELNYEFKGNRDPELMDPEVDGLKILELQRRFSGGKIGAFAQRTSVTRDGIETRVFHRWDGE